GATPAIPAAMPPGSSPGMTTGTGSARSTSTPSKGSGRCCGAGSGLTGGSRRSGCRCTWGSSSSCTTSGGEARPCWDRCSSCSWHPGIPDEPSLLSRGSRGAGLLPAAAAPFSFSGRPSRPDNPIVYNRPNGVNTPTALFCILCIAYTVDQLRGRVYDVEGDPNGCYDRGRNPITGGPRMARKKTEAKEMSTAAEPAIKPVRVELEEDVHRMLRKVAADEGVSMAAFARQTVERVVREEFKRRGLK